MSPSVGRVGPGFGRPREGCASGERLAPAAPVRAACPAHLPGACRPHPARPAGEGEAPELWQVATFPSSGSGDDSGAPDAPSGLGGLPGPSRSSSALSWPVSWAPGASLCGSVIGPSDPHWIRSAKSLEAEAPSQPGGGPWLSRRPGQRHLAPHWACDGPAVTLGRQAPRDPTGTPLTAPSAAFEAFTGSAADTPGSRLPDALGEPPAALPRGFAGREEPAPRAWPPWFDLTQKCGRCSGFHRFACPLVTAPSAGGEARGTEDTEVGGRLSLPASGRGAVAPPGHHRSVRVTSVPVVGLRGGASGGGCVGREWRFRMGRREVSAERLGVEARARP